MSHSPNCLNCEVQITGKFCSNCGQKTDTHRITFKHFIFHDILHGVWHFEKGILFTLKEAMLRPGKAALDYIEGKRIRYYNVFYLILLLIGLGIFIENVYINSLHKYHSFIPDDQSDEVNNPVYDFLGKYVKFFLALAIPAFSLNSFILFNKKKLFYSEHLIIFGMMYLGIIMITLVGNLMYFFEFIEPVAFLSYFADLIMPFLLIIYLAFGFYGAFGNDYKKWNFALRLFIYLTLIIVELKLLGFILKTILLNQ
ncbi:DUF3667 domain-containing protein [Flavobacterium phycosphaerae]|uniref:DUF3667 domain-containing protein n=1 Tax=Flavobacterium phycosphaerae TaxID=2697515 RepID=UPI0013894EAD|nr:DUF3667 domain-containing protein [Flavobacterium phycosphaerae]